MSTHPPSGEPARVFLLVENRLVRETLSRLFQKRSDLCVVGEDCSRDASDFRAAPCDIVVMDDLNTALELCPHLQAGQPTTQSKAAVLIGMEEDEQEFLSAARSGVSAYLLSDASANDVVEAVRAVARGGAVCSPRLCLALFRSVAQSARLMPRQIMQTSPHRLTLRQQQLVSLVAMGMTNKEIGSRLNLSEFTIKNHLHRIMKQLHVDSRERVVEVVGECDDVFTTIAYANSVHSDRGDANPGRGGALSHMTMGKVLST